MNFCGKNPPPRFLFFRLKKKFLCSSVLSEVSEALIKMVAREILEILGLWVGFTNKRVQLYFR